MSTEERDAVIAAIYMAAHAPERWSAAIEGIARLLGGVGATIEVHDRSNRNLVFFADVGMPEDGAAMYVEHYHSVCPRLPWGTDAPAETPFYDYMFLTERDMSRLEFYADFLAPFGFRYVVGGTIRNDADELAILAVHRLADRGHAGDADVELTRELLGHLCRARVIECELERSRGRERALSGAIDRLSIGVVALDAHERVLLANREALRLARAGVIRIGERITATGDTDRRAIQALIANAAGSPPSGGVALVGLSAGEPLSVTAVPVASEPSAAVPVLPSRERHDAAVVLYLADPSRHPGLDARTLRDGYRLTAAEAELALALARGASLSEHAEVRGISRHTARALLVRVRAKLGVSSQRELVRRLLMFAPPIDPP